jgi:hypothetical protein
MTALFHLEANEPVPAAVAGLLAPGELNRAGAMARLSQVEGGRFGAGPASIRLGTYTAATPAPGGEPMRSWRERIWYKDQPETGIGAQERGRAAQAHLGFPPTPGVGGPTRNVPPGSKTEENVMGFIRAHARLAEDWLKLQVLADPKLFHSLEALERYVDREMRGHLRAVLFAQRSAAASNVPGAPR